MSFAVVILSKTDANLNRCVDSIRARGETCRVLVVDDGLRERRGDCEYIAGAKPFIFSRNANLGIMALNTRAGRDVILMNDDAELLTAHGFTGLSKAADKDALTSCAIRENVGNFQQHPRVPPLYRPVDGNIAFVCVYIPWKLYKRVGPLDENFTEYGWEDTDYCLRVRRLGGSVKVYDHCHVSHRDGSTFRTAPDIRNRFEAGKRIFEAKWGKGAA